MTTVGPAAVHRLLHRDTVCSVFSGTVATAPTDLLCVTVAHERVDGSRREVFLEWAAKLTGLAAHPHLSPCTAVGLTENGRPYLAVGTARRTLADLLSDQGPMPPGQVRALGVALSDAVAVYHRSGLIHGAIQPAHILVGSGRHLQLTAYDVTAPVLAAPLPPSPYTAPEHLDAAVAGEVAASPAGDVYALATVLYAALGGRLPWVRHAREDAADPLLRAAPVPHIAGVDCELTDIIGAALSPDPRRRPTAETLRQQLTRLPLAGPPSAGRRPDSVAPGLLPRRGLRPVTVAVSTELAPYRPSRERIGLRPRLRSIATATAGVALTGALLGGAALATYAATNPESSGSLCTDPAALAGQIGERLGEQFGDQAESVKVIDSWCAADGQFVVATVDHQGGTGGSGDAAERLAWRIEGEELVVVGDCADPSLPASITEFLGC
ncbi:protein kinase [Glycomyces sp. NRRL B-16210]|uniref:protein kinase domain-containing protein n=1 Tax=Glycomyces sp. NRRL B-16210 TaxID=1463821 RepID=UPI0014150540|nr:protein kinase [Glycomyces sp. NRRL B-16210]